MNSFGKILTASIFFFACMWISCGGGGGGGGTPPAPLPVAQVTINITGLAAHVGSDLVVSIYRIGDIFLPNGQVATNTIAISLNDETILPAPQITIGSYEVYAYVDVNNSDGNQLRMGDYIAGPVTFTLTVAGGGTSLDFSSDFALANSEITMDTTGIAMSNGSAVKIRIGPPGTPCSKLNAIESYGVINSDSAIIALWNVPDGTYSLCSVLDLDRSSQVTGLPAGRDMVSENGSGLVISGTGSATITSADLHALPEVLVDFPGIDNGSIAILSAINPTTFIPQAFGWGIMSNRKATVQLSPWVLNGNAILVGLIDSDKTGPFNITLGDLIGEQSILVADENITPYTVLEQANAIQVNLLAKVNLSGLDDNVLFSWVEDGFCLSGSPIADQNALDPSIISLPSVLGNGTAQVAIGEVPAGPHNLCLLVDLDRSGIDPPTPGDLYIEENYIQPASGGKIINFSSSDFFTVP